MSGTVSQQEIHHFQKDSLNWWQEEGPFAPLHALNTARLSFLRDLWEKAGKDIKGQRILDVGCGGGLVCEPLARLGAKVTGIDADAQAIAVAKDHARTSDLAITYQTASIESFSKANPKPFQTVLALEIVEHVEDLDLFFATLTRLVAPGGLLVLSTLNRTFRSWALGKMAAEYLLGWVPPGTHDWKKFIRPSRLAAALSAHDFKPVAISGLTYDLFTRDFTLTPQDTSINYIMAFRKQEP